MREVIVFTMLWILIPATLISIWASVYRRRHPPTAEMIESASVLNDRRWLSSGWKALAFSLVYDIAGLVREYAPLPNASKIVVLLIPVPVFVWFIVSFFREGTHADEFTRLVRQDALAWAFWMFLSQMMLLWLESEIWPPPSRKGINVALSFLPLTYFIGLFLAKAKYMPSWRRKDASS